MVICSTNDKVMFSRLILSFSLPFVFIRHFVHQQKITHVIFIFCLTAIDFNINTSNDRRINITVFYKKEGQKRSGCMNSGWELLSQFPQLRYFPNLSALSKHTLDTQYHVNIWQVSPQLKYRRDWKIWYVLLQDRKFAHGEIKERSFRNPQPRSTGLILWSKLHFSDHFTQVIPTVRRGSKYTVWAFDAFRQEQSDGYGHFVTNNRTKTFHRYIHLYWQMCWYLR